MHWWPITTRSYSLAQTMTEPDRTASQGERPTLAELFRWGCNTLLAAGKPSVEIDTGLLLEFATGHGALSRLTNPDLLVGDAEAQHFRILAARRAAGEPVHRITGTREFYGLELHLSPATLVPRPDTEVLVDAAIPFARDRVERDGKCRLLDLGTGTGAIALAIANEVSGCTALGVDLSDEAVETANGNARRLKLDGVVYTGQSSDTDTVVASAKAYVNALNRLILHRHRGSLSALMTSAGQ